MNSFLKGDFSSGLKFTKSCDINAYVWTYVCQGLWDLHCAPLRGYRLRCAPPTAHWLRTINHDGAKGDLCPSEVGVAPNIFHFLVVHMEHAQNGHFLFQGTTVRWVDNEHTQVVHKGTDQGTDIHFGSAQCSFVLIQWCTRQFCVLLSTLMVHNTLLSVSVFVIPV